MSKIIRLIFTIGVIATIIGAIDPLEGSLIIVLGSIFISFATFYSHDRHRKVFAISSIMIVLGVSLMFYLSHLGGFGGDSDLSWWWALLIIPYPIGWLTLLSTLVYRLFKK